MRGEAAGGSGGPACAGLAAPAGAAAAASWSPHESCASEGAPRKKPQCQVVGCTADLIKSYCVKRRLCQQHIEAAAVQRKGHGDMLWRFCFQCGKLEPVEAFEKNKRSCRARLAQRKQRTAARSKTFANLLRRTSSSRLGAPAASAQPATSADGGCAPPCSSGDSAGGGQLPPVQLCELMPQHEDVWHQATMMDVTSPAQSAHVLPPPQLPAVAFSAASVAASVPLPPPAAEGTISEEMLLQLLAEELDLLKDDPSSVPAQVQQAPAMHGAAMQAGFSMACANSGSLAAGSQQQPMLVAGPGMLHPLMVAQQQQLQQLPDRPASAMAAVDGGIAQPGVMAAAAASVPCMLPTAAACMPAHLLSMEQGQSVQLQAPGPCVNVNVSVAALKQQYAQVQHMLHGLSEQLRIMAELEQAVMPAPSGSMSSCMHMMP